MYLASGVQWQHSTVYAWPVAPGTRADIKCACTADSWHRQWVINTRLEGSLSEMPIMRWSTMNMKMQGKWTLMETMPPWILSYCTSEFRSWDGETIGWSDPSWGSCEVALFTLPQRRTWRRPSSKMELLVARCLEQVADLGFYHKVCNDDLFFTYKLVNTYYLFIIE